jgi:hypothetical protein
MAIPALLTLPQNDSVIWDWSEQAGGSASW